MEKEILQKALDLSSARTMDEFKEEVLRVYIEQKEVDVRKGPIRYRMAWGRMKEFEATAYSHDGRAIVVEDGSDFAPNETKSLTEGYKNLRDKLVAQGVVKEVEVGKYVFNEDYTFDSFSSAASVIRGVVLNGTKVFKEITDN